MSDPNEYVTFNKYQINAYIQEVDNLIKDHKRIREMLKQQYKLMTIQEATYQARLDDLRDAIIDAEPQLVQGLMHAYKLMNGTA